MEEMQSEIHRRLSYINTSVVPLLREECLVFSITGDFEFKSVAQPFQITFNSRLLSRDMIQALLPPNFRESSVIHSH